MKNERFIWAGLLLVIANTIPFLLKLTVGPKVKYIQVKNPSLDTFVKFKMLDTEDVEMFVEENISLEKTIYMEMVLKTFVYNLTTDVAAALKNVKPQGKAREILVEIYNGCLMLNPLLDPEGWVKIASSAGSVATSPETAMELASQASGVKPRRQKKTATKSPKILSRARFLGLQQFLSERIIGQTEAVDQVVSALKRAATGMNDDQRPIGVFLLSGSSGLGKTLMAKTVHEYVFGSTSNMIRIDCGEYQLKHEGAKLIGSPVGFVGSEEGGYFTNRLKDNPNCVILLDEVEKAHPDIWNTFLTAFDEGRITDAKGQTYSLKNTIIFMTTNLGNKEIITAASSAGVGFSATEDDEKANPVRSMVERESKKAINKHFKPEFMNRIDKVIVFNHLTQVDLLDIAKLEFEVVTKKLSKSGFGFQYTDDCLDELVRRGTNSKQGARGLAKVRRESVEDLLSNAMIKSSTPLPRGTIFALTANEGVLSIDVLGPANKRKPAKKITASS